MPIMSWYYGWRPYVPVAQRRARAAAHAAKVAKKEKRDLCPVRITGRVMAHSFWGQAWCQNLEHYSDYANRLPRGRTYARNGSIVDLQIKSGHIEAIVSGSEVYRVRISIKTLTPVLWKRVKTDCSQSIDSLMDLLQGRFSEGVMKRLTQPADGLFPRPAEIEIRCSCPDWAYLCKHAAAVLYGVGARLDTDPELLFTLRNVDHLELIGHAAEGESLDRALTASGGSALGGADLGEVFGIELEQAPAEQVQVKTKRKGKRVVENVAAKTAVRSTSRSRTPVAGAASHEGAKRKSPKTARARAKRKSG
jgi:uncharacterized Zn finger protein